MKIIFVCGSAERGKDGVGDYTRLLAGALIEKGCLVFVIALNDKFVDVYVEENQLVNGALVRVLRLPSNTSYNDRLYRAKEFIETINPDWLSLQYVSFSFQEKGLPISLGKDLKQIGGDIKWHIMLHELWCGMNIKASFKEKVLGKLQKIVLKKIIYNLKPTTVFTNLLSYKNYLLDIDIEALVVPVYSNIGLNLKVSDTDLIQFFDELGIESGQGGAKKYIRLGFFGSIYQSDGIEKLIFQFCKYAKIHNKRIELLIIGDGKGLDIKNFIKINQINYKTTGRLSEELLDQVLRKIDVGIMTSTADGLDKSGSAIAFLERGIPVVIRDTDISYQESMKLKGLYQIKKVEDVSFVLEKKFTVINRLDNAVCMYIKSFK